MNLKIRLIVITSKRAMLFSSCSSFYICIAAGYFLKKASDLLALNTPCLNNNSGSRNKTLQSKKFGAGGGDLARLKAQRIDWSSGRALRTASFLVADWHWFEKRYIMGNVDLLQYLNLRENSLHMMI